jgi:hypothetical protein
MRRMLCTECGQTDRPNTLIGGSDVLELVLWACFVVPGLAYCGWRHTSRRKVCAHCGSLHLVRESRAARDRAGETSTSAGGRVVYSQRPLPFLGPPGTRFRRLTASGAVASVALVSWAVVSLDLLRVRPAPRRAPASARASVPAPSPEAQAAAQQARARAEADPSEHPSVRRYLRKRECQRLCNEFHGNNAASNRDCLARCMDELESDAMRGLEGCKDSLDPASCPFLLGPP